MPTINTGERPSSTAPRWKWYLESRDMPDVKLAAIDLNLLNVLATGPRAAQRHARRARAARHAVGGEQRAPARADSLWRPLVVRRPHGLEPTARAARLLPSLRAWLEDARRLVADLPSFDPAHSTRTFCISCTDAVAVTLLQPVLRLLGERAPGHEPAHADARSTHHRGRARARRNRSAHRHSAGAPSRARGGARVPRRDGMYRSPRSPDGAHPALGGRLRRSCARGPRLFDRVDDTLDRALARHGKSRVVRVALPHFSSVPHAVLETDCVATLSSRLARAFSSRLPLRVLKLPVALDPIEVRQVWHRRSEGDGAVQFLRTIVRDAARLSEPRERGRRSTPHPRSGR
jgi:DNA-binding transcriptional LysR family regulator